MAAKRKLFMVHAGELAHRLVRAIGPGGVITQFARSYAQRQNRPGLLGDALRMRELESTIGREALLLIAADLRPRIPPAFASRSGVAPRPEEVALADAFFAEFLASICRALISSPGEAHAESEAFRRDLRMYQLWTRRPPLRGSAGAAAALGSPFPDRCALLLDPSMMEVARRAAADLEVDLVRLGARMFAQLGRQHGTHRASRKRPPKAGRPMRPPGKTRVPRKKSTARPASGSTKRRRKRRSPRKG